MTIRAYWSKRRVVTSSSFSERITTQLRDFHMVSPQVVFTLLKNTLIRYLIIINSAFAMMQALMGIQKVSFRMAKLVSVLGLHLDQRGSVYKIELCSEIRRWPNKIMKGCNWGLLFFLNFHTCRAVCALHVHVYIMSGCYFVIIVSNSL